MPLDDELSLMLNNAVSSRRLARLSVLLASACALLALQACSTKPLRTGPPPPEVSTTTPPQSSVPADNSTPKAGGRFYDQDGPPLELPADLATRPDAVPRLDILSAAANRPYSVFGQPYVPLTAIVPFKQRGIGSWYGRMFHGRKTSNGEVYDMFSMTAAHPTLPLPSYARVTSVQTGKQVIVRVNDRGPFLHGRIMDLSYAAAYRLGYSDKGSTELEVELLQADEIAKLSAGAPSIAVVKDEPPKLTMSAVTPVVAPVVTPATTPAATSVATPAAPASPAVPASAVPAAGRFYLQIGAFSSRENADAAQLRLSSVLGSVVSRMEVVAQDSLFKLHAGPYANRRDADVASAQVKMRIGANPFVLQR
jgi:rare lipoprotein A